MRRLLARVGLTSVASTASTAGLCTAGMCAAAPAMIASALPVAILGGAVWVLHLTAGLVLAPASLVMLVRSFARHRRPLGVGIAGTGVLLMVVHYVSHLYDGTHGDEPLMYAGAVLLALGAFIDWRAGRAVRRPA